MQLIGSLAKLIQAYTCSGGFGDDLASIGVIDNQYFRNGDEEESSISIVGATEDDIGIGRFRFGLNRRKDTICSDHF